MTKSCVGALGLVRCRRAVYNGDQRPKAGTASESRLRTKCPTTAVPARGRLLAGVLIFLTFATGMLAQPVLAQPSAASATGTLDVAESGTHILTVPDLGPFLDTFVRAQLLQLKVAGAVVVVVKDGAVLLSRGYGFADIEKKIPMTEDTLVRPASVSKLFTAIAVLQLVEQHKLDLDRDVNGYLDFRIPTPQGGTPVTLRLLLTHRAGFEDHLKDMFKANGPPDPPGLWLRRSLPYRLFPNGDVSAYSNYGYALAGYVVAKASGERFEDYAATHILKPLDMERSTFEQPPPEPLAKLVARGYPQSAAPALPYFETLPASVGGLTASGADMGRFMLALLNQDPLVEPSLMRPLAFEEDYAAGNRFIGKHGLTNAVVTHLALLPEAGFGLFVSYNSASATDAQTDLLDAIADRYFKREPRPMQPISTATVDARAVAGAYQRSQRADTNFLRVRALAQQLVVEPLPDGRIRLAGGSRFLVETAPLVFEGPNDLRISFRKTAPGGGMAMRFSRMPIAMEWERVPLRLDRRWVFPAVRASLAVMFVTMLLWPAAGVVRKRRRRPFGKALRDRREHLWVRVVLALDLLAQQQLDLLQLSAGSPAQFGARATTVMGAIPGTPAALAYG